MGRPGRGDRPRTVTLSSLHRPAGSLSTRDDPVRLTTDDAGWSYCGLHVVRLASGETRSIPLGDTEGCVVPISGGCRVETSDGEHFELRGRVDVFDAVPDLCYLPRDIEFTIQSAEGGEFAVASARCQRRTVAFYREAADVAVEIRGAGPASRQINRLLGADVDGPDNLIVVEVLTPSGNWSSYPPHKHDESTPHEVPLEEIYYFRIGGEAGFGHHRTYTADGAIDETVTVADGDVFLVPRGYHGPSAAAPGYDMYYLNVMAGPGKERAWKVCYDPAHQWLSEAWSQAPVDPRLPMSGSNSPRGDQVRGNAS
ncbi:MAG: 5-deoxy-glucuronate isomerase [Acidimicrobiia bacterium]|nr:5-deoxy-glucuronate isomerase [Acidimicrobiia bacterium]MDQ3501949.1 5-deoxy-glucuronate isomerase [Actinomycetota bacterium]